MHRITLDSTAATQVSATLTSPRPTCMPHLQFSFASISRLTDSVQYGNPTHARQVAWVKDETDNCANYIAQLRISTYNTSKLMVRKEAKRQPREPKIYQAQKSDPY